MSEVLATYNLQVIGPRNEDGSLPTIELKPEFIAETEENLTDLLPNGFGVRIREWFQEEDEDE